MIGWEVIGGAIAAAFIAGLGIMRTWLKRGQKVKETTDALDTHKRIDARKPVDPDDPDDITRRLREHEGK